MHELSIVESLIEQVEKEVVGSGHEGRILRLDLIVGRLSGERRFDPVRLRVAFARNAVGRGRIADQRAAGGLLLRGLLCPARDRRTGGVLSRMRQRPDFVPRGAGTVAGEHRVGGLSSRGHAMKIVAAKKLLKANDQLAEENR